MKRYFVTGIGTDVGKTVVSAILTEALQADYWKPVQSGSLEATDTHRVRELVGNSHSIFHPEAYRLQEPLSPHAAAKAENIEINPENITVPDTENTLIIEGAGGLMVPLNDHYLMLDLLAKFNCPAIVVSRNYLGSINHTLLTLAMLKEKSIPVAGIVFNGEPNPETESFILNYTGVKKLFSVLPLTSIGREEITAIAETLRASLEL